MQVRGAGLVLSIIGIVLLLAVLVMPKCVYADCFCAAYEITGYEITGYYPWVNTEPECGSSSVPFAWENSMGHYVSGDLLIMYWNEEVTPPRWNAMTGWQRSMYSDVYEFCLSLSICPTDPYEPLTDCNEDDADGDGIPDLCDPWPNTDNSGDMFQNWVQYSDGGMGFCPAGDSTGDGFTVGTCTGDITLMVGGTTMSLQSIMAAACDCNSPSDFAVVPYSPPGVPIADLPDLGTPTPPIPSGGLSPGGGQSGDAGSSPNLSTSPTVTVNLSTGGGQSGNAVSTSFPSFGSTDLTSIECNTAATAQNSEQLVEGQNHVRDYLDAVQQNTLNSANNTMATASNTQQLVEGQNDVRDYLDAIQDSNVNIAGNVEGIVDNTGELIGGQNQGNEYLSNIQNNTARTAVQTRDIADLLQEQIDNDQNADEGTQDAADDALSEYQIAEGSGNYTNYGSSDVPDTTESQADYEAGIQSAKDTSGISSAASQVGVDLSAAVTHMDVNIWGYDIVFDFAKWESFYDLVGVAFLSLCYLLGFMMIVRG